MKKLISILVLISAPVIGQAQEVTVSKVIEDYANAVGGDAYSNLSSIYLEQTATSRGRESSEYIFRRQPDSYLKQTVAGTSNEMKNEGQVQMKAIRSANTSILFVDGKAYQKHSMTGGKYNELPAAYQSTLLKDKDILPRLLTLHARESAGKFKYAGTQKLDGEDVYVIVYDSDGEKESYYISAKTKLLVKRRETVILNSAGQTMTIDVLYQDYRAVGDIQIPYKEVQQSTTGAAFKTLEIKIVELNKEFEADIFKH